MKNKKDSTIREKTHESVDKIIDKAKIVGDSSIEKIDYLKQKSLRTKRSIDGYIQDNPEKSILIAAGIGIVIGAILTATLIKSKREIKE